MKINFISMLFFIGLSIFGYTAYKQKECKNFQAKFESQILSRTIDLIHNCTFQSKTCLDAAVLYRLEQKELLQADLKEMGCK